MNKAKEAVNQNEVDTSNIPEAARKAAQELREDAQELREEAEKEFEELRDDGTLETYRKNVVGALRAAANKAGAIGSAWAAKVKQVSTRAASELQNPVVILNVALGAGVISTLLRGYANNQRYLKGKSDTVIISTVTGASAFLALDAFLSTKYYKKFDKKSF